MAQNELSQKEIHARLSDKILEALNMALEQEDVQVAEQLINALELAMTRSTGGKEYVERREYPADIDAALKKYTEIRRQKGLQ